jgi:hypothetical protein|tara:strand:+ start:1002 stop:1130 length:129 start_codon:yes stop_codon:yes gene_type:complete
LRKQIVSNHCLFVALMQAHGKVIFDEEISVADEKALPDESWE